MEAEALDLVGLCVKGMLPVIPGLSVGTDSGLGQALRVCKAFDVKISD